MTVPIRAMTFVRLERSVIVSNMADARCAMTAVNCVMIAANRTSTMADGIINGMKHTPTAMTFAP